MENYYLVYDQGGQSTRGLVFDAAGNTIADARASVETHHPRDYRVEMDAEELLQSLDSVSAQLVEQLGADVARIESAGLVTQRSSLVCWDKTTGKALSPILSWQDLRAENSPELASLVPEELAISTGLRPSPHYGASKIRWCLDNLPAVSSASEQNNLVCGPLASYLLFHLSSANTLAADPANASRTLLWNIRLGEWDDSLLDHFQIPKSVLPPLQPSLSDFGEMVLADHKIPIKLMNGDQCAAFYGRGKMVEGTVYVNAGTGVFVATPWAENTFTPKNLLKTLVLDDGQNRAFVAEGTVNGGASALQWAADKLGLADYDELDQWCRTELSPALFLNGVGGLGAPFWQPEFRSEFIGGASASSRMVSVLESIVFMLKVNLERLQGNDHRLTHIVLGGGLGASSYFCHKLASLAELPVFRPDEIELTARGAAFLLAGQPEGWDQQDGHKFEPVPDRELVGRYRHWLGAIKERLGGGDW